MNNSLEFIKQHVKEWPNNSYGGVILFADGTVNFYAIKVGDRDLTVDLSEHFSPDYYTGKVWTREEFEACGVGKVNWDEAPDWATCYGVVGFNNRPVWYNSDNYEYVSNPREVHMLGGIGNRNVDEFELVESRQIAETTTGIDSRDNLNDGKKYEATIIGLCGTAVKIDIYRVLDAYPQVDPHIEHLIKKALKPGERGHKDKRTDYLNIIESAQKALILLDQKERLNDAK